VSNHALNWAWEQPVKPAGKKLVLAFLADRANDELDCWWSTEKIAEKLDLAERTVRGYLTELEREGRVRRERGRNADGTFSRLVLTWVLLPTGTPPPMDAPSAAGRRPNGTPPPHHRRSAAAPTKEASVVEPSKESPPVLAQSEANSAREPDPDDGADDQDQGHDTGGLVAELAASLRAPERSGRGRR
jgi:Helix-turn-helix domain